LEKGFTWMEKLAGFTILLVFLGAKVTLLVIAYGKGWFQAQNTYQIKFNQGYNLHSGSDVRMFNTEIGKVVKAQISRGTDENQVIITIKVLAEYADLIRQDSVAEVQSTSLFLGSEYLTITPGSRAYPLIEEMGTIPSQVRKTIPESLQEFLSEENINKAKEAILSLANLINNLKNHEKVLYTTLQNLEKISGNIAKAEGSLGQLVMKRDFYNRMEKTLNRMDGVIQNTQNLTGDLRPTAKYLQEVGKTLSQEMDNFKSIMADIKGGTKELPGLMDAATDTTRSYKDVADALKANPLIRMTSPPPPKSQTIHVEPRNAP
jgi:phospholipid/cholesterol/gamma-HCH transport system substrate-binding protein